MNNILQKLDVNKSCGPDDISPILFKCFSHYLSPSLCSLFNRSLRDGVLPNAGLNANVCPVYKGKGDKNCVNNYRPISLLSVVSKVAERCIYNNVISVMAESIFKGQHGFMKGKSTTTQLTQIFHLIGESVDNHGQVDALYMDFSKAFNNNNWFLQCTYIYLFYIHIWYLKLTLMIYSNEYKSNKRYSVNVNVYTAYRRVAKQVLLIPFDT